MSILSHFIRSLLLAITFSFIAPLLLIAVGLISFVLMSHLPFMQSFGELGCHQLNFSPPLGMDIRYRAV